MAGAAPQVQYRDEFIAGFAKRQSLLKDTTTKEMMVKGNSATFLVANTTGTAVTRGTNGLIPYQDNDNTQVTAVLTEKHAPFRMTGFNIFQSQADQRAIMQMNAMALINNDIDAAILAELANGTLDTGAAVTANTNEGEIVSKAIAQLINNGVPMDGQVFAVISAAFIEYLSRLDSFASADFVNVKPMVNYPGQNASDPNKAPGMGWYEWKGVKWIMSSQITGAGTATELCYMFHRSAIGHACNLNEIRPIIGYDEEQDYSWTRCSLFHGAKLLQNSGVVRMVHNGSALVAT
jgi:hypothetical protein